MNRLKRQADLILMGVVIAGFAIGAAQKLGAVPVPDDGDESMILQDIRMGSRSGKSLHADWREPAADLRLPDRT